MVEDRSLDDFADNAGDDRDGTDAESEDDNQGDAAAEASEAVTATATWTTDGADCDRCGESVSRRWRDGGTLVCAGCMSWEK